MTPCFDSTPMIIRADAGDGSVRSGQRTVGPLFDSTPVHHVINETTNVNVSPVPECTPKMQDTLSQTADGTEVVTQEYMVEEQLAKYEAAQAAKKAKHQKELKAYYRKFPKKLNPDENSADDFANDPSIEVTEPPLLLKKPRVAVAKRKVVPAPRVRRSPRFSVDKMKSAKRQRTSVSDQSSAEAPSSDDVASDFEAHRYEVNYTHFYVFMFLCICDPPFSLYAVSFMFFKHAEPLFFSYLY